jgi:hypothetical protein
MEITIIDARDSTGWLAAATRIDEIYMTDILSMVTNVKLKAGKQLISRLNILDHGNANGIEIGSDWIHLENLHQYEPTLFLLRPLFEKDGIVHLQHCNVGSNQTLLLELSRIFGVPVYAGTGEHNPVYRFNWGNYNRAKPNGKFEKNVGRP